MVVEVELVKLVQSETIVEEILKPEDLSTRAISSESDTSCLGAYVYYVLCPGAVKEPVDMGAGIDYLIRLYLYTNIVKLCLKNKDSKQLNFCERRATFFFEIRLWIET